jgi:myo-inositol-1(or 4)-monophosphatase
MVRDGRPAIGVAHDPVRGETFAAASGGPAFLNGDRIESPGKERLGDYVVSLNITGRAAGRPNARVRRAVRAVRNMGSAALALAYVGNGRFDGFVQSGGLSLWDIAAAGVIASSGGALVTDLGGGPWLRVDDGPSSISVLAAPPAGHAGFLALVRGGPGPRGSRP